MAEDSCQHDEAAAEQRLVADVAEYGCHFLLIPGDDYLPSFVYSVGLTKTYGHPEIICFGLPRDVLWSVVDDAHQLIKSGRPPSTHGFVPVGPCWVVGRTFAWFNFFRRLVMDYE